MTDIFLKILNMSLSATFVCAAVVILRLLLRRAPKWITLLLWVAVAGRLIGPISFESSVSVMPMADTVPQNIGLASPPAVQSGNEIIDNAVNPILQAGSLAPTPEYSANPMQVLTFIASIVWVAGISLMLLYTVASYIRLKLRVRISLPLEGEHNVRLCDSIDSPFILGFIRPVIYLPLGIDEADAEHVLAHEKCHIRRLDFIWKPLGFLLLAVHWFNPIMWAAYVLLCRDIECACDEAVLKKNGSEIKATYATALINCSVSRKSIAACPLAFGETGLKMRVKNVLSYKKPTLWLILAGLIVCAAVGIFLLTDPASIAITELYEEEAGDYAEIFDGVETLTVYQGKFTSDVYDADTVREVIDTLKEVRIKKRPVSRDRSDGRDMTNRVQLGDGMQLCFSEDFGEFWIYTGTKPTLSYKVVNPEVAKSAVIEKSYFSSEVGFTTGMIGSDDDRLSAMLISVTADARGGYLEVMLKNLYTKEVTYGDKFALYRYDTDGEHVSCMDENKVFDLIGHSLKGHSSVNHKYYLDGCDLTKSGKYRFETEISIDYDGFVQTYKVWAEFTLPDGGVPSEVSESLDFGMLYVLEGEAAEFPPSHVFLSSKDDTCVYSFRKEIRSLLRLGAASYEWNDGKLILTLKSPNIEYAFVFTADGDDKIVFDADASTKVGSTEEDSVSLFDDGAVFTLKKGGEKLSYSEQLSSYVNFMYDSLTFDIDGDGKAEDCYLMHGITSGLFTFELVVVDENKVEQSNTYTLPTVGDLSFEKCNDGEVRLKVRNSDEGEILYDIGSDEDGRVTFTNGEDEIFYSGYAVNDTENKEEICEHSYEITDEVTAACTTAGSRTYTCEKCGDSYTEDIPSLGHSFTPATCTSPSTCTVCYVTEGKVLPHTLTSATCTSPATCTVCYITVGDVLPHSYTAATCTFPAECSVCGDVSSTALGHDFAPANMEAPKTCRTCGATEGEALPKLTIDMTSYVADTVSVEGLISTNLS